MSTSTELLFTELTQRVLNDPEINESYKEYIKNCIDLDIDEFSKEKIIKQILDHYICVSIDNIVNTQISKDYVLEMISESDVYQRSYYPKMLKVDDLIRKAEIHNKAFGKSNNSLDNLEYVEQEFNQKKLAELEIMPLYLHKRHWYRILNMIDDKNDSTINKPTLSGNRSSRRKKKK